MNDRAIFVPLDVLPHHGSRSLAFADLEIGDRVHVRATLAPDRLTATELKLQNPNRVGDDDDGDFEIEGVVTNRSGECLTITFRINDRDVRTDAATVFDDIVCPAVVNGVTVEVHGRAQPDGTFLATRIERDDDDGVDDDDDGDVEIEGLVTNKMNDCPTLSFRINIFTIRTDAATLYRDISCQAVVDGVRVEVHGLIQPDGNILATRVERKP